MIRRPPKSTRTDTPCPTRRGSDLIGDACLDNDCTILFFGGFGGSEDRIGMTYQTVDNNNFRTAERIQGAVAFAAVDGSGGTDPDPDPTPDPVVNDGIAAPGAPGDRKSTRLNSSH